MKRYLVVNEYFVEPTAEYESYRFPKHLTVKELEDIQIKTGTLFVYEDSPVVVGELKNKLGKIKTWDSYDRFFIKKVDGTTDKYEMIYGVEGLGKVFQGTDRKLTLLWDKR